MSEYETWEQLELQLGDEFAVQTPALFGRLIRLRDRLRSADNEATFNHCGTIVSKTGRTFESRRRIGFYDLRKQYSGGRILIVRPLATEEKKMAAIKEQIRRYNGRVYPWWRIGLHIFLPSFVKYLSHSGTPVCSEMVGDNLYQIGIRHCNFWGTTPDILADEWRHYREYKILFDGILLPAPVGEGAV